MAMRLGARLGWPPVLTIRNSALELPAVIGTWLPWVAFLAMAAVSARTILHLTSSFTFFGDEWFLIMTRPGWSPDSLLTPHNEHWITIPVVVYKLLLSTAGLGSYRPYVIVAVLVQLAAAALLMRLLRRRVGAWLGLLGAVLLMLLGSGWEDILWAFQIGEVGSIAFGLAALDFVDRGVSSRFHVAATGGLIIGSLMCSGIGLVFLVAIGAGSLRARRQYLWALVPPVLVYAAWYAAYGRQAADTHDLTTLTAAMPLLPRYVYAGIQFGLEGVLGLAWGSGAWLPLACLFPLVVFAFRSRLADPVAVAALTGLGVQFVLSGLIRLRAVDLLESAASPRYRYLAAVFILLLGASALGPHLKQFRRRLPVTAVLTLGWALALALNAQALAGYAAQEKSIVEVERSEEAVLGMLRGSPDLDPTVSVDPKVFSVLLVTPGRYLAVVDAYGAPQAPATPADLASLSPGGVDRVLVTVLHNGFKVAPAELPAVCTGAPGPDISVRAGESVVITDPAGGRLQLIPWYLAPPGAARPDLWFLGPSYAPQSIFDSVVPAGSSVQVRVPDPGWPIEWKLRVLGTGPICAAPIPSR